MKKYLLLLAVTALMAVPVQKAGAVDLHQVGVVPKDAPETQDRSKEDACDCCQKCKAAKSTIKPKHQEGSSVESDGCDDCCTRCGKILQPSQQETPPEIIEKKTPPDIIDKSKQ